ncbi:hypothetical protein Tco_0495896 [Tanacetum coccineum]
MANLSSYGSDVLSEVPHSENTHNDMLNQSVQEMSYSEQTHLVNYLENEITSDSNIIPYSQHLLETQNAAIQDTNSFAQQDAMILSMLNNCQIKKMLADFEKEINYLKQTLSEQLKENELLTKTFNVLKNESKEKEAKNIDKVIALEKKVKELDNIVCKMGQSAQTAQQIRPMLYDGTVIAKETNVISIVDSEETLILEEESRSKMLLKQNFGKFFVPQQELSDEQAFWLQTLHPNTNQFASSPVKIETPRELPKFSHVDSMNRGYKHWKVSSPYEDLSDIGSPRADDHELLELPYMPEDPYVEAALQAPPSPDYVPGPEEPEQAPPSPDYVPGPEHDDDEIVAEDQPYAEDASPIAQSPDYVPESDPEADPEEDGDEDPEEDPIDYPADGGDDGDDEMDIEEDEDDDMDIEADEEDEDDEMDVEIDEEAEEEHLAPAYPVVVALPATAPSAEETEPFETDESAATPPPHPAYRMTARITIPEPLPVPAWSDSEVARLLAISSPPASPLSPWSSSPPQIPFPLSPPPPVLTAPPPSPIRSLGYRAATIRMRAEAAATSHSLPLPPPFILSPTRPDAPPPMPTSAPTSFPPLHREDRPEVNLPPRMGLGLALGPRYEVGESSAAAAARPAGGFRADYGFVATMDREIRRDPERYIGYGITDSWDEIVETLQGAPVSTDTELILHMFSWIIVFFIRDVRGSVENMRGGGLLGVLCG